MTPIALPGHEVELGLARACCTRSGDPSGLCRYRDRCCQVQRPLQARQACPRCTGGLCCHWRRSGRIAGRRTVDAAADEAGRVPPAAQTTAGVPSEQDRHHRERGRADRRRPLPRRGLRRSEDRAAARRRGRARRRPGSPRSPPSRDRSPVCRSADRPAARRARRESGRAPRGPRASRGRADCSRPRRRCSAPRGSGPPSDSGPSRLRRAGEEGRVRVEETGRGLAFVASSPTRTSRRGRAASRPQGRRRAALARALRWCARGGSLRCSRGRCCPRRAGDRTRSAGSRSRSAARWRGLCSRSRRGRAPRS